MQCNYDSSLPERGNAPNIEHRLSFDGCPNHSGLTVDGFDSLFALLLIAGRTSYGASECVLTSGIVDTESPSSSVYFSQMLGQEFLQSMTERRARRCVPT